MQPLAHGDAPECQRCPLFVHLMNNQQPEGTERAVQVFTRLNSRAVREFHLHTEVLAALQLRLTHEELFALVDDLDAIFAGLEDAKVNGTQR